MRVKAPSFWFQPPGTAAWALAPVAAAYAGVGRARWCLVSPASCPVPLVVVGNVVAGGAGKTPVTLALAQALQQKGRVVHLITKGYGGALRGPVRVDDACHTFQDVGDEALLLAAQAPTWMARDRGAGWVSAATGADVVVSDDGLQSPRLAPSFSLLVVDGVTGFGNGYLLPAGPLREPLSRALERVQAVVQIGGAERAYPAPQRLPVLYADFALREAGWLQGARVVAFAGIGRPEKFFAACRTHGADVVSAESFPDHYPYTEEDMRMLAKRAENEKAVLVTTTKDRVRVPRSYHRHVRGIDGGLVWRQPESFAFLLASLPFVTRAPS